MILIVRVIWLVPVPAYMFIISHIAVFYCSGICAHVFSGVGVCVCSQEMLGIISNESIWADLYEMVLGVCAGRAIINPRAFPVCSALSFHAPDLRV